MMICREKHAWELIVARNAFMEQYQGMTTTPREESKEQRAQRAVMPPARALLFELNLVCSLFFIAFDGIFAEVEFDLERTCAEIESHRNLS